MRVRRDDETSTGCDRGRRGLDWRRVNAATLYPEGFVTVSAVDSGLARTCTGCGKPLSRYNKQKLCQACASSGRANNHGRRAEGRAPLVDAAKLVQLRNNHGWTQEMLAGYAGLSCDMVKKLEQGARHSARMSTLSALAQALNVPVGALLSDNMLSELTGEQAGKTDAARQGQQAPEPGRATLLRALITERHWQRFRTFEAQFRRAARDLAQRERDPGLATLTVSSRQWERWYAGSVKTEPHPDACRVLEHMFGHPIQQLLATEEIRRMPAENRFGGPAKETASVSSGPYDAYKLADQISELVTWVEQTNVGDGTLDYLDQATLRLAHDCLTSPPFQSYERAAGLTERVFSLLRGGHQRIGQTCDLYVIAGKLCAVLSWMSSDLGHLAAAEAHTRNGWVLADQAGHDGLRALLLCAQSKNAYWGKRYGEAAVYARRGYEYNPRGTARVLLSCQEADALQALGKIEDAHEALARAEQAQESISGAGDLGGIFDCGTARLANYSIGTYLRAGSADRALQQAERAETAWRDGDEWAYGTWAQVQVGAAIAHLLNREIEGAAATLQPVLNQPAERRLATLTTRLHREVTPVLASRAVVHNKTAIMLSDTITDYCSLRSPIRPILEGDSP
jgi:transcriptional regulator with XRE-family HTH domain/tetratricopeptide (TPR) repeat protein